MLRRWELILGLCGTWHRGPAFFTGGQMALPSPTAPLTLPFQLFPACPSLPTITAALLPSCLSLSLSWRPLLKPAAPLCHSLPFFFSHSKCPNMRIVLTTSISFPSIPPLNLYNLPPIPKYFWKVLLMQLDPKWLFLTFWIYPPNREQSNPSKMKTWSWQFPA